MPEILRKPSNLFTIYGFILIVISIFQSPTVALSILALGLISGIMSLGVNMQWGYAGQMNIGSMGFAALGGASVVWISASPVPKAINAGGFDMLYVLGIILSAVVAIVLSNKLIPKGVKYRKYINIAIVIVAYFIIRPIFTGAVERIEAIDPSVTGYLGGFGLPVLFSWIVGSLISAGVAWVVAKVALGLRADYLAIATLGIAEILVWFLRSEEWLTRGVKNVIGLKQPVPDEVVIAKWDWIISVSQFFGNMPSDMATIFVRGSYCIMFLIVVLALLWLSETAIRSPWGRMIHAIRDNETASRAMGKDVNKLHLRVFILGSAVVGMAGAMLVTYDGQFTTSGYAPLRYSFLIWVMVVIGGSGNNYGSILGGMIIWLFWVQSAPIGIFLMEILTYPLDNTNPVKLHLMKTAPQMRLFLMGVLLLLVMRFSPSGLIPEKR